MTQEIALRIMNTNLLMNSSLMNTKFKEFKKLEWQQDQPQRDAELAKAIQNDLETFE